MSKDVEAVLFDLDGTLVNTLYSLQHNMNLTMEHFGFDKISEEQTKKYAGNGYKVFVEKSLKATADRMYQEAEKVEERDPDKAFELDQQADEVMERLDEVSEYYIDIFRENSTYKVEAYPGMIDCLNELKNNNIKIACVTNKSTSAAKQVLDKVFGENFFDALSADDGTHPLKPDTYVIRDICEKLNVSLEGCVMVGDTKTDMDTAKHAGIDSIGCAYGFRNRRELEDHGATICVDKASEIMQALRSIRYI